MNGSTYEWDVYYLDSDDVRRRWQQLQQKLHALYDELTKLTPPQPMQKRYTFVWGIYTSKEGNQEVIILHEPTGTFSYFPYDILDTKSPARRAYWWIVFLDKVSERERNSAQHDWVVPQFARKGLVVVTVYGNSLEIEWLEGGIHDAEQSDSE